MVGELASKQITTIVEAATRKPEEIRQYFPAAKKHAGEIKDRESPA